jgi:NAD(P)-dependent dehydrogenase (short-subunit alcohol dehydrogenase family)
MNVGDMREQIAAVNATHPGGQGLAARVAALAPTAGTVVVLDATHPARSWTELVEVASRKLLQQLGSVADGPVVLVVATPGSPTPVQSAAIAAARGVAGVAALERARRGHRVNTVMVGRDTTDEDLSAVLTYLLDDGAAGFTAGATIDLTRVHGPVTPRRDLPVLVTGAAGGLGAAVAEAFLASGRSVVITDLGADALQRQSDRLGVTAVPCDVTSPDEVAALAGHPALASGISSLQVLHGVGGSGSLDELDEGVRERSLRINGTGVWNVVDALLPALEPAAGSVVVLASQAGLAAEPDNGAYCAAKFAAVGYVEALAASDLSVRVHSLCPGPIDTPLMRNAFAGMAAAAGTSYEEYHAQRMSMIPLGRFGRPAHIGAAAVLLDRLQATGTVLAPTGAFLLT